MALAIDLPVGVAGFFNGNGGVQSAAAWRLHKTYKTYKTYKMMMGAPLYTPRVCLPQCGMTRAKMCRKGMQGNLMATGECVLRGRGACV